LSVGATLARLAVILGSAATNGLPIAQPNDTPQNPTGPPATVASIAYWWPFGAASLKSLGTGLTLTPRQGSSMAA
jgi:hypothetical protein